MAFIGVSKERSRIHMVKLKEETDAVQILYDLLKERTPEQSISHRRMPTFEEHTAFVKKYPYHLWYLIRDGDIDRYVGAVYLTKNKYGLPAGYIGLFIFKEFQGKKYGTWAVMWMLTRWKRFVKYANVSPNNPKARAFWERFGFKHVQDTLELVRPERVDDLV